MAEIFLNERQGDAGFQEMRGVAVASLWRNVWTCARLWTPLCLTARTKALCRLQRPMGPTVDAGGLLASRRGVVGKSQSGW